MLSKGKTVKLLPAINVSREVDRTPQFHLALSQTNLITKVTHLAECLKRSGLQIDDDEKSTHLEAAEEALKAAHDAERRMAEHAKRISHLERLAITDDLTGLLNRRGFEEALHRSLAATGRYEDRGILVYVDLDGFKPINDTYGHSAGDEVLRRVARVLQENLRETDYVGRVGGDEFAALLTRTSWEDGIKRATVLDKTVNKTFVSWQGHMIAIRASLGFQAYGPYDKGCELLSRADLAMYETKRLRTAQVSQSTNF